MINIIVRLMRPLISTGAYVTRTVKPQKLRVFFNLVSPISISQELIRIGSKNDGGYLIPNDLGDITACFSPGVSAAVEFEEDLALRDIPSYMADLSVNGPPVSNKMFHFTKKHLGITCSNTHIRLEDWINQCLNGKITSNLILQMDIEGSEYQIIYDTPQYIFNYCKIIVIEFHNLNMLLSTESYEYIMNAFNKLLQNFSVVHIHPNNCAKPVRYRKYSIPPVMEFTFLRNDCIEQCSSDRETTLSFPHHNDSPNIPLRRDYILPDCWYCGS